MTAHGDDGVLELVEATELAPGELRYVVRLTYASDGDAVSSAEVVMTIGDGAPMPMTPEGGGRYSATVLFPDAGSHAVEFRSEDPAAVLEHEETIQSSTTTASIGRDTTAPRATASEDGGGSVWLVALMFVLVAAMVVVAAVYARGRRPTR